MEVSVMVTLTQRHSNVSRMTDGMQQSSFQVSLHREFLAP
jgi:hypothetical protein